MQLRFQSFGSNQGNFFENVTACSNRTLKTTVATQLKVTISKQEYLNVGISISTEKKVFEKVFLDIFN